MNKNTRIQESNNFQDAIIKLAEGNPGALRVSLDLLTKGGKIDPDDVFKGFSSILMLDTLNIYGARIWMLYKDVCRENLIKTIAMLRACQLGLLEEEDLNIAIDNYGKGLDPDQILIKVQEQLPEFGKTLVI